MRISDWSSDVCSSDLGPMLKNAVLDLVGQIVEAHVAVEPAFVNACIGRALSTMKEAHEAARLYLHPDDLAQIGEDATEGYRNLTVTADPALQIGRASCRERVCQYV